MKTMTPKNESEISQRLNKKKCDFKIKFYSGYKKKETPRAVVIGSREFPIEEVIWRKRILDSESGKTAEIFKCKIKGEIVKISIYDSGEWSISFSQETFS